jgi:hypothetical protein
MSNHASFRPISILGSYQSPAIVGRPHLSQLFTRLTYQSLPFTLQNGSLLLWPIVGALNEFIPSFPDTQHTSSDTRGLLCMTDGRVLPMTANHHADERGESSRLRRVGGGMVMDSFGDTRWMGKLANTRWSVVT